MRLDACDGWAIPNRRPRLELHPQQAHEGRMQQAVHGREYVNVSCMYNCVGFVFGGGRTQIEPELVPDILAHDSFRQVSAPLVGDVVVYKRNDEIVHVGIVWAIADGFQIATRTIKVRSKWGDYCDLVHEIDDIPDSWRGTMEFYRNTVIWS